MARDLIGPALPPGFKALGAAGDEERDPSPGPALPPNYKSSSSESSDSDEDSNSLYGEGNQESEEDDTGPPARGEIKMMMMMMMMKGFFGPALPPGFKKQDDSPPRPIIGPALPPGFIKSAQKSDKGRDDPGHQVSSYFNSKETDSSEDEDIVGPMPAKGPLNYSVTAEFDKRAQRMKEKLTKGDDDSAKPITRESWMTELPPELKDFGLGPRTFKRRNDVKSGDRSVWTDTPADREKKAKVKVVIHVFLSMLTILKRRKAELFNRTISKIMIPKGKYRFPLEGKLEGRKETKEARKSFNKKDEEHILSGREKRLAEQVSSYNESKRSESLMDIHQKKLKTKAAEDKNKSQERIPFDRDKDLKVHRFDEAQKKALIRKSRELNTRFSHGKGSMFL
ncbi:hypothetical protein QTO34_016877 [Cnephaeus nilssonii]|uniref:GPALPP motifs-containing protein 1 n=1 Tax=Cnephaeus nilssonii TaxID=3371016 RepID=A0AA40LQQ3_CNENI|nr:hypothetical protein QTO34_016877 [Eptesicus nilssonii]